MSIKKRTKRLEELYNEAVAIRDELQRIFDIYKAESLPFVSIGNDELTEPLGDTVTCWICGKEHTVEHAHGKTTSLSFFRCGDKEYLCGVDGKAWKR